MLPEAGIFEQSTSSRGSALGEDRIRLVRIEPIGDDATIHCNTHVFSASGGVSYTALSYTWGSGRRDQTILLDGEDHRVSKNLYRSLHQTRQLGHHFSGWLWIDALSIDQENLQEKFHQVKIISKIFGHAKQTVVWLGPAYANSDQAMEELLSGRFRAGRKTHYERILASPAGAAIRSLCERRYWSRLWVVQEVRAARSAQMMCGSALVPLAELEAFLQPLLPDDSSGRMPRLTNELRILQQSPAARTIKLIQTTGMSYTVMKTEQKPLDTSLWTLLQATADLQCADPRDRVYALLSVATEGHEHIEPDYEQDLGDLIHSVTDEKLNTVKLSNAGDLDIYCAEIQGIFADSICKPAFWETLPRLLRPRLA